MELLKYLFKADLSDGSAIIQTQEDVSTTVPGGSAFSDVNARLDECVWFGLYGPGPVASINLENGYFTVNGVSFLAGDLRKVCPDDTKRKLIYYRRVTRHFNAGDFSQQSVEMAYIIGYQFTVDGTNHQQVIMVS